MYMFGWICASILMIFNVCQPSCCREDCPRRRSIVFTSSDALPKSANVKEFVVVMVQSFIGSIIYRFAETRCAKLIVFVTKIVVMYVSGTRFRLRKRSRTRGLVEKHCGGSWFTTLELFQTGARQTNAKSCAFVLCDFFVMFFCCRATTHATSCKHSPSWISYLRDWWRFDCWLWQTLWWWQVIVIAKLVS